MPSRADEDFRAEPNDNTQGRQTSAPSPAFQRHFSVAEVAALWNLSEDAIRKLFKNEPGVVVFGTATRGSRRRYTTVRIPESVLQRVYKQHSLYFDVTIR